jgi:probable F420-dependent oxidoreductase
MKFGIATFVTDETLDVAELARMVEQRGYESLWLPEHTHIPADRQSRYPDGTDLPREYTRALDPFIALAIAAGATSTLRLGTAVCLAAQHDPIVLAKTIASLDFVSDGRIHFGVGAGWNHEEMRNHGLDPKNSQATLREHILAMRQIWTQDEASFDGTHVNFDRIWAYPKPRQRSGPEVLLGGHGPKAESRVQAFADSWMPRVILDEEDTLLARVKTLKSNAAADGKSVGVSLYMVPARPSHLERYAAAGVERCIAYVHAGSVTDVTRRLDKIDAALRDFLGEFPQVSPHRTETCRSDSIHRQEAPRPIRPQLGGPYA